MSVEAEPRPEEQAGTTATPLIEVEHLKVFFSIKSGLLVDREVAPRARGQRRAAGGRRRRDDRTGGRVRLRQDHDLASHHAPDRRDRGRRFASAAGHHERRAQGDDPIRREMQMVFQDPFASLNPRKRVGRDHRDAATAPRFGRADVEPKVRELLGKVGLQPEHINRYPHEFSGGQRQRIGVARALALEPRLIVLDEPVSALDVSVQAQIINLLDDLQDDFGLTYLFVAHDLSVVRHVSDRIAVMYLGKLMELSPAQELYTKPIHPYTSALLAAIPIPDPEGEPRARADRRLRRAAQPDQSAVGLRLPHPVPAGHRDLQRGGAAAGPLRERPPGGLPPPDERGLGRDRRRRARRREPALGRRRDADRGLRSRREPKLPLPVGAMLKRVNPLHRILPRTLLFGACRDRVDLSSHRFEGSIQCV